MSHSETMQRALALVASCVSNPAQDPRQDLPAPRPIHWDTLQARMEEEVAAGFSGAVLVVRADEIVLNAGYGLANREEQLACTTETVFAIGSTPIDFTRAGVLLIAQAEELALTDPITTFFPDVPKDKRAITIDHLLSGRSGLVDFVDLPTDRDPDHAWIDRDEFLRRVWGTKLLFEPGKGHLHSHAAWGLLAAVVEVVSGETYPAFTRKNLFEPAGMQDTGFFGEPIAAERLAIGYGPRSDGEVNAPPYWGKTSWLVMGSGGQVSTTGDMLRWHRALRAEEILGPDMLARYFGPPGSLLDGGDMYGFQIFYTQGPGSQMFLVSNSAVDRERQRSLEALAGDLARLVMGR